MSDEQIDVAALREAILRGRDSFFFPRNSDLLRLCNEVEALRADLEALRADHDLLQALRSRSTE